MTEKATVRIYESDKKRLKQICDATGQPMADVVAEYLREPAHVCPECGDPFDLSEIDPDTVEEYGIFSTGVDKMVKGQREVKSFECPNCGAQIRPDDVEAMEGDGGSFSGVTSGDLAVTDENGKGGSPSNEA